MNRRVFLVALAVVPVAALIPLKIAASWRPVKVALIDPPDPKGSRLGGPTISFSTHASAREIVFPTLDIEKPKLFDLKTGQVRTLKEEGVIAGGNGFWRLEGGKAPRLIVRQNEMDERIYLLPSEDADEIKAMPAGLYRDSANVTANATRVEFATGAHYYRWNTDSRELERDTDCDMESELGNQAISRDGESLINAGLRQISALSTQSGEWTRHDKVPHAGADGAYISAFGAYCVYEPVTNSQNQVWSVLDTATARDLWNFTLDNWDGDAVTFSPDEKYLIIGRSDRRIWEFRDVKTGAIVKTLPMVPDATSAVFSPDCATLYSIANGVLYKQRAR